MEFLIHGAYKAVTPIGLKRPTRGHRVQASGFPKLPLLNLLGANEVSFSIRPAVGWPEAGLNPELRT